MKKYVLALALVCCFTLGYSYQTGDTILGLGVVYSPLELGTDWGEVNVEDETAHISHDAKLGHPGVGGEIQALYFVHPRVAAGLAFEDQVFSNDLSSGWYVNTTTRHRNFMAVGRYYLTPESAYKVYVPFAVGVVRGDMTINFSPKEHFRYTGFAYHAGLGVERLFGKHWGTGFEVRYNGNRFHDSKTISNGDHVVIYPRANYVSGVLRVLYLI